MTPRAWLPAIAAALLSAVLTWWLTRPEKVPPHDPATGDIRDDVAWLERRLAELERRVADLSERPSPATVAPRDTPPKSEPGPTLWASAKEDAKEDPEGRDKSGERERLAERDTELAVRHGILAIKELDQAALAALRETAKRDPLAALDDARRLLGSREEKERASAIDFLANATDPVFLPAVRDALGDALRNGRRGDVGRLLHAVARMKDRAWSAKQMVGEADTPVGGDLGTAWASKGEDMGEVWIELDYERAVRADAVRVHETHNPGAVARVLAKALDGTWDVVWEGRERPGDAPWVSEIPLGARSYATSTIRIVLDTNRVAGWNEVDAVELVGDGLRQWAKDARASSSFAD